MSMNHVFLGIPTSDLKVHPDIIAAVLHASPKGQLNGLRTHSYSCLPRNFNELFCAALNARKEGITHFLMLHNDIVPHGAGWLDSMLDEMNKYRADVLSVIVPLKSNSGITSTAIDEPAHPNVDAKWRPRRLNVQQVLAEYPETFTNDKLLLNTGCMLIDLRKSWVENIWFQFEDIILKRDGKFVAENVPEDWDFSRRAAALGAKLFATRKIQVTHYGHTGYGNAGFLQKKG